MLLKQWDRLVKQEGLLNLQLVLPAILKGETMIQLHQDHGHQGIEHSTELVRQRCYWPGMSADIKQWVQACERCQGVWCYFLSFVILCVSVFSSL